jgi:hypothetical protein
MATEQDKQRYMDDMARRAATLPDDGPADGFSRDGQRLPW